MPALYILLALTMGTTACLPIKLENSRRLVLHPEFPAAIKCPHCGNATAPLFTQDCLRTINALERELEARP